MDWEWPNGLVAAAYAVGSFSTAPADAAAGSGEEARTGSGWSGWLITWLLPSTYLAPLSWLFLAPGAPAFGDGDLPASAPQAPAPAAAALFEVSAAPPLPFACHAASERLRPALPVAPNGRVGTPFANERFEGEALLMHRPLDDNGDFPYKDYFACKTRVWELRVRGRFRKPPVGELWAGCVLEDFDYRTAPTSAASLLAGVVLPVLRMSLGQDIYFTWGEREEAAETTPEPELAHMVARLPGFDQIIVSRIGDVLPGLGADLSGLGVRRNALGAAAFTEAVARIEAEINTEAIYTFCVWGLSRFYNAFNGHVTGLLPGGLTVNINNFMHGYPVHVAMYDLAPPPEAVDGAEPLAGHAESRKSYIFDFLLTNSDNHCPSLPLRYAMPDTPHAAEGHREPGEQVRPSKPNSEPKLVAIQGRLLLRLAGCLAPLLGRGCPGRPRR